MQVMFVDDEPQILKGIVRMLECSDVEWEIQTANSGQDALDMMAESPADILVSDMKMPGMDGAALLQAVSELYPETVRIVLSGQANKEAVYRAIAPMHQYLSKPCEAETLRDTIARSCSLRDMLDSTKSHEFLGRVTELPSLPDLYQKVVAEIDSEMGSVANVGKLIAQDPAMTAKILQLANSAIFGLRCKVTSPGQAASMIGMDTLKSLVLSLQLFKSFSNINHPGHSIEALTSHSLNVATMGRNIANCEGLDRDTMTEVFTAGLLHDVGKLVLITHAGEEYIRAIEISQNESVSMVDAEKEVFGISHEAVGAYLLSLWGLPQSIVEGVALHHLPESFVGGELTAPAIVCIANQIVHGPKKGLIYKETGPYQQLLQRLNCLERTNLWEDEIDEREPE